jgi:N-acetylneuraminic acid mutarotase
MAYDPEIDRIVLYIGSTMSSEGEILPAGETWAYDFNSDTWTNLEGKEVPVGLLGAEMVYDAESDRMVMFGGLDTESFLTRNDTWTYDFESNTWTKMEPTVSPLGRNFPAMAYHERSDRVILFGGYPVRKDTWAYDLNTNTWEEMEPAEMPSSRLYCDMVYYPVSGGIVLFGGARSGSESPLDDTWVYLYETGTWSELAPGTYPSERGWYAAAYSTRAERVILFGGGPSREEYADETWVFDPVANTWTNVSPGP